MKNIFLKFFLLILLSSSATLISAQEYVSTKDAVILLNEKKSEANEIIILYQNDKNMEYFKAVSTVQIINGLLGQLKAGASTEAVAKNNTKSIEINKVQRVTPLFPDSTGKYGSNWVNEEILSLLSK